MKQHIQILINLLTTNDLNGSLQHYLNSTDAENTAQLAFLFQQGQLKPDKFEFYQELATKSIEQKGFSIQLLVQIKNSERLSFFTPALQLKDNFSKTNHQQQNVLHCLLAGNQANTENSQPPFNYLRSMMLFESNDSLRNALCQRDDSNLTPIEIYFVANKNLINLPDHELTALLALIEIESKQQAVDGNNYTYIMQSVGKLCRDQNLSISSDLQRLMLIAAYYSKAVIECINKINSQ